MSFFEEMMSNQKNQTQEKLYNTGPMTFADALEAILLVLARNTGMNSIDSITQLRAKQNSGEHYAGVDVMDGTMTNFERPGIVDPLNVKEQIIKSATETANRILRINNVIAVTHTDSPEPGHNMPPPGSGMGMY